MIRFVTSRPLGNWPTAVAAVVAGLLLTPRACEAGCGDYVQFTGIQFTGRSSMTVHSQPDLAESFHGGSNPSANNSAPQQPCQGLHCSERSLPPLAPAPQVVDSIERCALAAAETLPNFICRSNLPAEPDDLVVDGFRSSILRPPR